MATWRQASANDIPDLLKVADAVHPDLPESAKVLAERVQLFPEGCLILAEADRICGYAISHPIRHGHLPALDSQLGALPSDADTYYIHDLAILPACRGRGLAAECINRLLKIAERYTESCLVSVYGTAPFWGRYGFVAASVDGSLAEKIRGYGDDATYLSRARGK